jgi:hypothetical protein
MNTAITAAANLLAAREAAKAAEEAKRAAEAIFCTVAEANGLTEVETPEGVRVAVEHRPRRDIDVAVLAEHLAVDTLASLLKEVIDPKAFDAAVARGEVSDEVADKAVTTTFSTQVRVYGELGVRERRS